MVNTRPGDSGKCKWFNNLRRSLIYLLGMFIETLTVLNEKALLSKEREPFLKEGKRNGSNVWFK